VVTGRSRSEMCRPYEECYSVNLGEILVSRIKRKYLKGKINSTETKSMNKNIRDLIRTSLNFRRVTNLELI